MDDITRVQLMDFVRERRALRDRARRALTDLAIVSEGTTQNMDRSRPSGERPSRPVGPGRRDRLHDTHAHEIASAHTTEELRRAVERAEEAVYFARHAKRDADTSTEDGRLEIGRDPRPAKTVAKVFGISERQVRRYRQMAREAA